MSLPTYQITVYPFKLGYASIPVPSVLRFHTVSKEWGSLCLADTKTIISVCDSSNMVKTAGLSGLGKKM